MTRIRDAMLGGRGYGAGAEAPMLDLTHGGQNGYMTDFTSFTSNTAYIPRNMICKLIAAPRGFQDLADSAKWVDALKSLVELHAKSIEGLQSTLSTEWAENAVGGAGQMQEDLANVTEARSTPTFVWTEKYNRPINAFLEGWITNLLMDPVSKYPRIVTSGGQRPVDLLPDYTGATMLFFEPDPTHTKVLKAWLCTNMHPKTGGTNEGRRDLTSGGASVDYSVEFTALTQTGRGPRRFAQLILDQINLTGVNPNTSQAFAQRWFNNGVDPNVNTGNTGYSEQIQAAAQAAIPD